MWKMIPVLTVFSCQSIPPQSHSIDQSAIPAFKVYDLQQVLTYHISESDSTWIVEDIQ